MICHRTRGPSFVQSTQTVIRAINGAECLGSACAMWVRERIDVAILPDGTWAAPTVTGRGVCADNPNAVPWLDPNEGK